MKPVFDSGFLDSLFEDMDAESKSAWKKFASDQISDMENRGDGIGLLILGQLVEETTVEINGDDVNNVKEPSIACATQTLPVIKLGGTWYVMDDTVQADILKAVLTMAVRGINGWKESQIKGT